MASKAQLKAQAKYDRQNTKQVILKLNIYTDADILTMLSETGNKQGYIKELVRQDMRNNLTLSNIKALLSPLVKKYEICGLCVFGSYARGEATPNSDVDIVIEGGNYQGLEYFAMIEEMKKALGKEVDVITQTTLDNPRNEADKILKMNIEREKVRLI